MPLILFGWAVAGGSPGPATLAISSTSMASGRRAGLILALGVVTGSAMWGLAAALGLATLMIANAWVFEVLRYLGAAYLLYLAIKSLRSAWLRQTPTSQAPVASRSFQKGLLLHLANPKAILSWGAIYSVVLIPAAKPISIFSLYAALCLTSAAVFLSYAILFSSAPIARGYLAMKRWFDLGFAALFGAAGLKLLFSRGPV